MGTLRKAGAYSSKKARPYTRKSRKKNRAYIKTVPGMKIAKFNIGNIKDFNAGKHQYRVRFMAQESVQVRDNSIEACRMLLTKILDSQAPGQYYLIVKVYPHHMLRENKTAAGAGADRLSTGMAHSFGIIIGRAALLNPGTDVFVVTCLNDKTARIAKNAMAAIKSKIPCKGKIVFEKLW